MKNNITNPVQAKTEGKKPRRGIIQTTATLGLAAVFMTVNATGAFAVDTTPEPIPGSDGALRVIKWIVWGAGMVLLGYFVFGLVKAGRARNGHGDERAEAPLWPAVMGGMLGGVGTIWTILTGI